jgi:ATP-dependent DNA ligase
MGLEGIVSKRRDKSYRSGRSPHWIKVKNPNAPAEQVLPEQTGSVQLDDRDCPIATN